MKAELTEADIKTLHALAQDNIGSFEEPAEDHISESRIVSRVGMLLSVGSFLVSPSIPVS